MMATAVTRGVTTAVRSDADEALTALYMQHYASLVRLAALLLDDRGLSEEVVQDSYIKMHGAWHRIEDPEKALAYLRQTVVNLARSRMRRRMVALKHAPKPMPDGPSAEYGAMAGVERAEVMAGLRKLPARQREAVVLRYYGDLSEKEIAIAMGCSSGAVKSHIHRGMAALAKSLEALA
jgi:RNA polymerase sigma-70 factor (sigma-E family)